MIQRTAFLIFVACLLTTACKGKRDEAGTPRAESVEKPHVAWSRGYIVMPAGDAPAAMYAAIQNTTAKADTLLRVTTPLVDVAMLHATMHSTSQGSGAHAMHGTTMTMVPVTSLEMPADTTYQFAPGGTHIMLTKLKHPIAPGDSVEVTFHFAHAGAVSGKASVIRYADVDTATAVLPVSR